MCVFVCGSRCLHHMPCIAGCMLHVQAATASLFACSSVRAVCCLCSAIFVSAVAFMHVRLCSGYCCQIHFDCQVHVVHICSVCCLCYCQAVCNRMYRICTTWCTIQYTDCQTPLRPPKRHRKALHWYACSSRCCLCACTCVLVVVVACRVGSNVHAATASCHSTAPVHCLATAKQAHTLELRVPLSRLELCLVGNKL
jgi:hypothetical protein